MDGFSTLGTIFIKFTLDSSTVSSEHLGALRLCPASIDSPVLIPVYFVRGRNVAFFSMRSRFPTIKSSVWRQAER
eukprot:119145-Prymnesium_polylepis.1